MSNTDFARERIIDIKEELEPLLEKHYREIAHYQDIELDPAWNEYYALDDIGALRMFTARQEGELVGYAIYVVKHNLHYRQSLQAAQDVIFVDPDKRGIGGKLIEWCDSMLKEEGVQVVYHHVKKEHDFGKLLERIGYEMIDIIYGRRLDKWQ